MGEREFDLIALRELIARDAIDLWQPDILRLGSVEAWRASAAPRLHQVRKSLSVAGPWLVK